MIHNKRQTRNQLPKFNVNTATRYSIDNNMHTGVVVINQGAFFGWYFLYVFSIQALYTTQSYNTFCHFFKWYYLIKVRCLSVCLLCCKITF